MSFVVNELFQRMGSLGGAPPGEGVAEGTTKKKKQLYPACLIMAVFFATRDCSEGKVFPSFILTNYFPEFQFALKMHRANAL